MDAAILLRWYDRQLRAGAEVADADEVVRVGPVWAATYPRRGRGFVTYRAIPAALDLDALIGRVLSHYVADERVDRVEWKTRGHDPAACPAVEPGRARFPPRGCRDGDGR